MLLQVEDLRGQLDDGRVLSLDCGAIPTIDTLPLSLVGAYRDRVQVLEVEALGTGQAGQCLRQRNDDVVQTGRSTLGSLGSPALDVSYGIVHGDVVGRAGERVSISDYRVGEGWICWLCEYGRSVVGAEVT